VLEARQQAALLLAEAQAQASELLRTAGAEAEATQATVRAAAFAEAASRLAAHWLVLEQRQQEQDAASIERTVGIARVLAERILGEQLRLEPELIVALARRALDEARGARQILLGAHPDDASSLEAHLGVLGFDPGAVTVVAMPTLARGSLRIETELGVLDGELSPRLDHLTAMVREQLQR
jgi:flagellar assembly protein FliH